MSSVTDQILQRNNKQYIKSSINLNSRLHQLLQFLLHCDELFWKNAPFTNIFCENRGLKMLVKPALDCISIIIVTKYNKSIEKTPIRQWKLCIRSNKRLFRGQKSFLKDFSIGQKLFGVKIFLKDFSLLKDYPLKDFEDPCKAFSPYFNRNSKICKQGDALLRSV